MIICRSNLLLRQLIVAFIFFDLWVAWDGARANNPARQVQHAGIPEKGEVARLLPAVDKILTIRPPSGSDTESFPMAFSHETPVAVEIGKGKAFVQEHH